MRFIWRSRNPSDEPTGGAWYVAYLRPKWEIVTWFGDAGHVRKWPELVVPLLAKHYHLSFEEVEELNNAPYGMPRGRAVYYQGEAWLAHGKDWPKVADVPANLRFLISEFGLNGLQVSKRLHVVFDEHETMQRDDQRIVRRIIGKVPYK